MKKIFMTISALAVGIIVSLSANVEAKAALPCTYDIIKDANGNITNATEMYQVALANQKQAEANLKALQAAGTATPLELQQAKDAVTNTANVAHWWLDQVNNSKAYLGNITDREKFEDKFAANRVALADLTKLQAAKTDADGAVNIANGTLKQIQDVEKAIAGYEQQLATSPSVQTQINELNVKLAALKADYAKKLTVANEKIAIFENYLQTLSYAGYDLKFENYQYLREINRNNALWLAEYLKNN